MIVVSIKFKFQDLNPIINRDRARWMKKEPSGASTKSCNIYCISKCKQKWLLNGWFDFQKEKRLLIIHTSWIRSSKGMQLRLFFSALIIFWNLWRPRTNFENISDWCCLLNRLFRDDVCFNFGVCRVSTPRSDMTDAKNYDVTEI